MDPIAHTLVGATLAESGLKKWSAYATTTLVIGANLPDIDVVANVGGLDASLYFRRGWTHGILALLVLPLVLAATVWLWHHWRGQHQQHAPQFRWSAIVALSFVAVWSHPLLDWLNTYGVRLLMPFDERWFYGDSLFIIDPWFWLLAAVGVVLARSHSSGAIVGWCLLGCLTTAVVIITDQLPLAAKLGWFLGLAAIAGLRWHSRVRELTTVAARTGLVALIIYIGVLYGLARLAEARVAAQFQTPREVQANPVPGVPFSHRLVLVYDDHYRIVSTQGEILDFPREEPNLVVRQAMQMDSIRGFVTWMRYPVWETEESEDHWTVRFWDLRYIAPGETPAGIGFAQVEVARPEKIQSE